MFFKMSDTDEKLNDKFEFPTIQELYNLAKHIKETPPISLNEKELNKLNGKKHQNSIFANPEMMEKFKALPKDVQEQYKDYGESYYARVIDKVQGSIEDSAKELICMVKSGISPKSLSENEIRILTTIYGKEWYKKADLESENDD